MFAPPLLLFTGPRVPSARANSRVVVVLPLVPLTHAASRPAATSVRICGDTWSASLPPIISPDPRPSRREAEDASFSTASAARVRVENRRGDGVVIASSACHDSPRLLQLPPCMSTGRAARTDTRTDDRKIIRSGRRAHEATPADPSAVRRRAPRGADEGPLTGLRSLPGRSADQQQPFPLES